ncbi:hypothetical protein F5544_20760 [Nocardia arthritidis]|uniref:OmpR/PhoB-type domain-containing protein n=1 Tax=Nocardia arthritidis TaxID=228602 RepID=A0A6G9YFF4_9NOCA|nr:hypothetical protein F5544_20760 [Nocardia arthritidis]
MLLVRRAVGSPRRRGETEIRALLLGGKRMAWARSADRPNSTGRRFCETRRVWVGVLGPVEVRDAAGVPVPIGGVRVRMLVARLALAAGRPVPVEVLIDALWGEDVPADAGGALQALVSRLRRALRGVGAVDLVAGGYRLAAVAPTRVTRPGTEVDADESADTATDHPPNARLGAAELADLEARRHTSAEFGTTATTRIPANHFPDAETPADTRANRHKNTAVDAAQSAAFEVDAERFEELAARAAPSWRPGRPVRRRHSVRRWGFGGGPRSRMCSRRRSRGLRRRGWPNCGSVRRRIGSMPNCGWVGRPRCCRSSQRWWRSIRCGSAWRGCGFARWRRPGGSRMR